MLDCILAARAVNPTLWELTQWRLAQGEDRQAWEELLDLAPTHRWDDALLPVIEKYYLTGLNSNSARPHVFRALFRKDIGGVTGVSESWFDASYTVTDGVSGKTQDFVDYIDSSHALRQTTAGQQVALPAARAGFSNALVAQFTGVNRYDSTRAAASWIYLNDGTGAEFYFCLEPSATSTQALFSTRSFVGNQAGVDLAMSAANSVSFETFNGVAGSSTFGGGATVANVPTYLAGFASSAGSPQQGAYKKSVLAASGATTTYALATNTLRIGADYTPSFTLAAYFRSLYMFRRVLTSVQRTVVQQYIQKDTGITP